MCHFITATLPPRADVDTVRGIATSFRRAWRPIESGPVVAQLAPGETYYLTTPNHCDCGTVLGSANRDAGQEIDPAQSIRKLKRKGWSESKIDRWLADKRAAAKRTHDKPLEPGELDSKTWNLLLSSVLESGATSKIGLMLHMYSGLITDAEIRLHRTSVSLADITPAFLEGIEEDRLYEFAR